MCHWSKRLYTHWSKNLNQMVKHVYNQFKYVTVKNRSISTEGPFISLPNVPPLPRGVRP